MDDSNMGMNTDDEENGPGSPVKDGVEDTEKACEFEQQHEHEQSITQYVERDVGIQDQKPAKGTGISLITSLQNMPLQNTSGALNTEHNEAQREYKDVGDSVLSNTLVYVTTDTSAYDKCVKLGEYPLSPQSGGILETDTNDAWYSMYNTLNQISLSDASVFKQELPFNPDIDQMDKKGYRAKKTGIPLITPLQNMPSQHISGALNTKHNEAQMEHVEGRYSVLSNTPTLPRPDADLEDENSELSHSSLVKLNTETSADDKCVKSEERSSPLQPGEIMEILETDTNDEWDAIYNTLLDEISPSDASAFKLELPLNRDIDQMDEEGYTLLYKAALEGHLEDVDDLISRGANPNKPSQGGLRPLHAAARKGHAHIVDFLILQGAEVSVECERGRTPFHTAAARGYVDILESLVAEETNMNMEDHTGWTPFNAAVQYGYLEAVKYLMTEGAKQNRYAGTTPLYAAARYGHLHIVKYFISKGADVNEENAKGMNPLHGAAARGHLKVLEYLIQQGSDVNKSDGKGWTPFNAAVQYGHLEAVKYLMNQGAKQNRYNEMTPLYASAYFGHLHIVEYFFSKGANVNEETDEGNIPLHGAAARGHVKVMEYLIQQGSDVNKGDANGWTPFNAAVRNGNLEIVKYLMTEGAKNNRYNGVTPLYAASQLGLLDIVKFFISHGADVDEEDDKGMIALHGAAIRGHMKVLEYLIQQGSDVNKSDAKGWTPFNAALQCGHLEAVKYLVNQGAKQNRYDGMTPLYASAYFGHLHIVEYFISKGADVNEETDEGNIPLHGAAARGHVKIMEYLIQHGSDVYKVETKGRTPLNAAIQYGHLEAVKCIMIEGAEQNSYYDMPSLLYAAAHFGHLHIVQYVISKEAGMNGEEDEGTIPLHGAASQGHINVIEYLIQQGYDVNKKDARGLTPFNAAVKNGHLEAVKYLRTKGAKQNRYNGMTPLYASAHFGHLHIVEFFISKGADVNEEDDKGMIPLHGAAIRGHMKVMEYLIQQGSDVNKSDAKGWTPFNAALQNGHLAAVKYLLTKGAKQNRFNGMTPLYAAARFAHLDIVQFLIYKGADVNGENENGKIPLHGAAARGHTEVMDYLIQQGSDVNKADADGWPPFNDAVQYGRLEAVTYLMYKGARQNMCLGRTPLYAAARFGHLDIVKFLISKGADVNEENENGKIPLHGAASRGHTEVMEYLIQQGSDVSKTDNTGWTPFNAAVQYGKLESVKYLLAKGVKENRYRGIPPLHGASRSGHFEVVHLFISRGADVNEEDDKGKIPLHSAAARGHMTIIEYLIQHGSDVNKSDAKGWTPFNAAVKYGHIEAVKYLITKGAEQNRYAGVTPLHVAARSGHLDIVKFFTSKGDDVNEEDVERMIPLHGAAARGHVKVMEHLIQQGSDVNKKDYRGWTPLHGAVRNGHLEVVNMLMAEGAQGTRFEGLTPLYIATQYDHIDVVKFLSIRYNVSEGSKYGKRPLHAASYIGNIDIVKYLLLQNANVNEQDHDGWTPLHAAAQEGHRDVVEYLVLNGADTTVKDIDGLTPLQAAVNAGHSIVLESDPCKDDPRCLQGDSRNCSTRGSVVLDMRDADTQSCEEKSTSQNSNVDNWNDCTQGDIAKRGADELSLKKLSTRTHDDDKDESHSNVNTHLSQRRGDPNEEDTGDPLSEGHQYGTKLLATRGYAMKKKVIQIKEVDTKSRAGELASHVVNVDDVYDCTQADNSRRGANEFSLKSLYARTHGDEESGREEHTPFVHAKLKYPEKGEQDQMLDQIEAMKSPVTTNCTDCSSPHGSQTWQYSGFDPPFLQTMETDDHPSEEPESRWHSPIDDNREMIESPSPMNAGNDLPINVTSVKFKSSSTHPPEVVHQKLYDGNSVSTQGTSSNPVWKIGTKHRTSVDRCPSIMALVHTFLQMNIILAIILAGSPVLVAGRDITERVTLQAGKPGVVPFHLPPSPSDTSQGVPFYTLQFKSKARPFCINGQPDIEGFKSPSQLSRFTTSVTDLDTSRCVNLNIDNVDTLDEGVYILTTVWHRVENVRYEIMMKEIVVQIPPGRAKCFITLSENGDSPYEVHCQATIGSVTTTISCYQNDRKIEIRGNVTNNGQVIRRIFLLSHTTHFSCCSHDVSLNVSQTMCNDFEWPHVKETTRETVNTVPTSVTTPTPQVESHTGSGACRQSMLSSLWHFTYMLVYLLHVVTTQ